MYKKIGQPWLFIVAIIIAVICYITIAGLTIPGPNNGDNKTALFKINGITELRFGIDIKGGVDVTFTPDTKGKVTSSDIDAAAAIINKRLDDKNITDRSVTQDYTNHRVLVRFPWQSGMKDFNPETAIKELGSTGKLTFTGPDKSEILSGGDVQSAVARPSQGEERGPYVVALTLKSSGVSKFSAATKKFVNQVISINMDGKVVSSPNVQEQITTSSCIVDGQTNAKEASDLANTINAGALPFALISGNFSTISPTLGTNALNVMVMAGIVAFLLICLFMLFYYRLPGFIACIGLCGHLAGTLLAMSLFNYTLTLPGIAGLILSIGMGVDCNIITAARIKEELRAGRTLDAAIDQGFDRSFNAILDGNVTVLIVGVILMWLGSATIKSFGFTLVAGVVLNFIMGIVASRIMLKSISKFSGLRKNVLYGEAAK